MTFMRVNLTLLSILNIGTIYEDVTTDVAGKIGYWQWHVTLVSTTLMVLPMFNQYEDMFLLKPSEVYCVLPNEYEIINSSLCVLTIANNGTEEFKCNKWHLKLMWIVWIKKTWLVFCDKKLKLLSTAIISRFGLVFGFIIYGLVSDSFGRKTAITFDVFAELILGLVMTFCDSEGWFRLIAFLKSLLGSANFYMGLILICEIASNSWRSWLCIIVMFPRLLALLCMVPLANSAPNTETYSFIACIYAVLCLIVIRWSPESPQWLLHNRKIQVAEKVLAKAAQTNSIKLCNDFKIRPVNNRAYDCLDETTTCVGMLSTYNIRMIFLLSALFWILYYFLWSQIYVRMYSEEDINYLLLEVFCIVSVFGCLTKFTSAKLTLRYLLLVHIVITGLFTAGVTFLCKGPLRSFLSSIALASGILAHALILNITPRFFAINIRATVVGCCHATGQLGSIVSYLLFLFRPINDVTLVSIELTVMTILIGLCITFPDVDDRELPDVMEDMDYFSELSKPLRWVTQKTNSPSIEELQLRVYSFGSVEPNTSQSLLDETRPAAKPIGYIRLWKILRNHVRRKLSRQINPE
ncbi:solute carrier family 22 member 5-like isoform X2 [Trichoplusia ni]|uniref:Solute carrier family 22 member 5-like isoform X2 n=1 Tax=Trichoplusia ni TaxID=7111 RepID=A0A7E5W0K9_TRINI|nr:solute carrier family 22 member 5-like isoform X2 [Trichoplusia ni]